MRRYQRLFSALNSGDLGVGAAVGIGCGGFFYRVLLNRGAFIGFFVVVLLLLFLTGSPFIVLLLLLLAVLLLPVGLVGVLIYLAAGRCFVRGGRLPGIPV